MAEKKRRLNQGDVPRFPKEAEDSPEEALIFLLRLLGQEADPYALAHRLLERFDRLSAIFDAPPTLLMKIEGVTPRIAGALTSMPDFFRVYEQDRRHPRQRIINSRVAFEAVRCRFSGLKNEVLVLQILDSKGYLQYMGTVGEGTTGSVPLLLPEILQLCLLYGASTVYVSHNHPSGNVAPSHEDLSATKELILALSTIHVSLFDHFIFGGDDFFSMLDSGLLKRMKDEISAFRRELLR